MPTGAAHVAVLEQLQQTFLDSGERIRLTAQWKRAEAWTQAQTMQALANAADIRDADRDSCVVYDLSRFTRQSEYAVRMLLGRTRLCGDVLGETWVALNAGLITNAHLTALTDVVKYADPAAAREVQARVLGKAIDKGWTPGKLRDAAATELAKVDPAGAERRARAARRNDSGVWFRPDEDEMATLIARGSAFPAREMLNEINRRADAMGRAGDDRNLGERQFDALRQALLGTDTDLHDAADKEPVDDEPVDETHDSDAADDETVADDQTRRDQTRGDEPGEAKTGSDKRAASPAAGRPARQPKRSTALLLVPLSTLLGGDLPGRLEGYGPLCAQTVRELAKGDLLFRRLVYDDRSGRPVDVGANAYPLSPPMRRWIDAVDRTCRVPGCTIPACFCDRDHAIEWPDGETTCDNCGLLCRRHHQLKTKKLYRLIRHPDRNVDWISPFGFSWHNEPANYEEFCAPDPDETALVDDPDPPPDNIPLPDPPPAETDDDIDYDELRQFIRLIS